MEHRAKLVDIAATVDVMDICDPNPTFVLASITSNEPDDGSGDGSTADDVQGAAIGTPDVEFQVRSARAGGGDGRVYTIGYAAEDASNQTQTAEATVMVRKKK